MVADWSDWRKAHGEHALCPPSTRVYVSWYVCVDTVGVVSCVRSGFFAHIAPFPEPVRAARSTPGRQGAEKCRIR